MTNWSKEFDEIFFDGLYGEKLMRRVLDKGYTATVRAKYMKAYIAKREKELLKQLIIIRDTELSDTPMEKSRAAYNINLLIKELSNE